MVKEIQISHLFDLDNYNWNYKNKHFELKRKLYSESKLELFMNNPVDKTRTILIEEISAGNYKESLERLGLRINIKESKEG